MKEANAPDPQETVRNQLENSDKGIVSYIPFKFAFKNLILLALCQKLPTAYFSLHIKFNGCNEIWCKNSPNLVQKCTKTHKLNQIKTCLVQECTNGAQKLFHAFNRKSLLTNK